MTGRTALRVVIILAAVALGAVLMQRADAEFELLPRSPSIGWEPTYSRVRNTLPWAGVAATLGAAGLIAADPRSRRRPWPPGAITVAAAAFTMSVVIAFYLLTFPPSLRANRDYINLAAQLGTGVSGAVIGAWAALLLGPRRRRRAPMRLAGLLVGGLWMLDVVLLILYGVIFG